MSVTDYSTIDENFEHFADESGCYETEAPPLFRAIPMTELMGGDYRVDFLCRGVLAREQPAIFGGPHKAFKTSIALELAVCLATGTPFLDHFDVPAPVKVCFFSGEGGLGVIQDTLRRIGEALNINIAGIENLLVTDRVPRLDSAVHLEVVKGYVEEHRPEVVFVDPLYLAMSGADTTNVFSMGQRLRTLNELCMPKGVTPVLLHHLRKNRFDNFAPAGLDDLSMAGFAEYAGQWVLLSRRQAYDADDPTHRLWVSFGGRAGHGSAWGLDVFEGTIDDVDGRIWQTDLRRQDEVRAEAHGRQAQKRIEKEKAKSAEFEALASRAYAWMVGRPDGVTKRKIKAFLQVGDSKTEQVVLYLEESGTIEPCKVEVSNNKSTRLVDGFRAVTSDDDNTLFD